MDSLPTSLRIPILRRLAADGDAQAQYALGWALWFGSDVDEDEAEGLRLLERAAEAGLPHAQRSLARRLREDDSLPADVQEERARALERKAARAGCPLAMRDVADHEIDAIGDPRVRRRVAHLLRRSLEAGNGWAGYALAMRVVTLRGDLRRVERHLRRAVTVDDVHEANHFLLEFLRWAKPYLARWRSHAPDLWRTWAEAGDPDAQTCLAVAHYFGRGVMLSETTARRLLRRAADGGHVDACLALLLLRYEDTGPTDDAEERRWADCAAASGRPVALWAAADAVDTASDEFETPVSTAWLLHGAKKGDPRCAHEYANVLLNRTTSDRTRREELRFRRIAAAGGIPEAQVYLAEMLVNGEGTRVSAREAVAWLRRAATQGYPLAQLRLGFYLHEGKGVRRDDREAVRWYRRAAAAGEEHALNNLGLCFKRGHGVRKDVRKAVKYFERATVVGENPGSAGHLGFAYAEGWCGRKDPALAAFWFRRGAALGDAQSLRELGVLHHNGKGVAKDFAFSAVLYRAAALLGDAWAAYCMGLCRRDGEGVAKDAARARAWFRRAATMSRRENDRQTARCAARALAKSQAS